MIAGKAHPILAVCEVTRVGLLLYGKDKYAVAIADIARRHELTTNMLSRWRHDPRFNDRLTAQTFLPVEVEAEEVEPMPESAPSAAVPAGPIEIDLNCGSRVRCWGAVNEDALYSVIFVLRRAA